MNLARWIARVAPRWQSLPPCTCDPDGRVANPNWRALPCLAQIGKILAACRVGGEMQIMGGPELEGPWLRLGKEDFVPCPAHLLRQNDPASGYVMLMPGDMVHFHLGQVRLPALPNGTPPGGNHWTINGCPAQPFRHC